MALAESSGDPNAHNTSGEDSRGLWQINVSKDANPGYASWNLFDPATNARAAYQLSGGGADFHNWTTYVQGAYLHSLAAATNAVAGILSPTTSTSVSSAPPPDGGVGATASVGIQTPVGVVTVPQIGIPNVGDVPGQIKAAAQGVTDAIGQFTSSATSGIANLNSIIQFIGDPKTATAAVMIWIGIGITLLGIVLFAISLLPRSTASTVVRAAGVPV